MKIWKKEAPSSPRSRKGFYRLTEAEIDAHLTVTRLDSKKRWLSALSALDWGKLSQSGSLLEPYSSYFDLFWSPLLFCFFSLFFSSCYKYLHIYIHRYIQVLLAHSPSITLIIIAIAPVWLWLLSCVATIDLLSNSRWPMADIFIHGRFAVWLCVWICCFADRCWDKVPISHDVQLFTEVHTHDSCVDCGFEQQLGIAWMLRPLSRRIPEFKQLLSQ